ncbi:unnamed protein product [Xylocopa violacea]|uniref:NADH dehydrogenase [ubiquinone] 1 beta subcomplex subunit 3 n=1 Tax=Xylocopa violacea TaxID=135666 RepID=A0ABP1PFE0_XYLVO
MSHFKFGPLAKVPNPDIYKVEDIPELLEVQQELAKKGLKDPWLRNEAWQYYESRSTSWQTFKRLFMGVPIGFGFLLVTLAIENYFGISYGPKHRDEEQKH